jgi:valyl-tRNA synthetase
MDDFSSKYDPKGIEQKWSDNWLKQKLFTPDAGSKKETYTISIPPPNVTGKLTLGHVLNNTIQDILIRYKKLCGYEVLWVPGMDHAGIATQVVVEERLMEKGIKKESLGREKFVAEVWKWKEDYARIIREQLRTIGCGLDWTRERFTLSEEYSRSVIKVFVDLYNKDLIYRGEKIINWCPRCLTAISNEQVETVDTMDKLYYIKYPLKNGDEFITVATTRPETMLGDTAVCVNPNDQRYRNLVGKTAVLPIMGREIPIIADEYVDPEFGTGALKVTPAHDQFDFELAKKHKLDIINTMNPDASLNENAGKLKGVDRVEARKKVLQMLEEISLLDKTEKYKVPLTTCERCHTVVEPRVSKQWFVKMKPLAEPAIKMVHDGTVRMYPKRWVNLYNHWMENVIDWVISRQLWWGHRIPVYYCAKCCREEDEAGFTQKGIIVSEKKPGSCPACGSTDIKQDEDVLDTWFSSWLWPFAALGWPVETDDLKRFYPTQTLVTAWDIIYLWVARMIMAGIEFTGQKPFSDVVFHTMVRDEKGRKMSKSLGNSPDPMDLVAKYGADALRLGIMLITPREQDVLFTVKSIDVGRKFCNKLWNASRLVWLSAQNNGTGGLTSVRAEEPGNAIDQWICREFNNLLKDIQRYYQSYEVNAIARRLYDYVWHTYCDWYLEFIKLPPYNKNNISVALTRKILILLHPYIPFITDELFSRFGRDRSILTEKWPEPFASGPHEDNGTDINAFIDFIMAVRNIRGMFSISPKEKLDIHVSASDDMTAFLRDNQPVIQKLAGIDILMFGSEPTVPAAAIVLPSLTCYVLLKGIDVAKEKARLEKEIGFLAARIDEIKYRLNNPEHMDKLSDEFRRLEQERLETFINKRDGIQNAIKKL